MAKSLQNSGGGNSQKASGMTAVNYDSQPTVNRRSTNGQLLRRANVTRLWKYAACLLLAFVLGIGQMWADCAGGTTIFSLVVNSQSSKTQISSKSTLNVASYATLNTGSTATLNNSANSNYDAITTTPSVTFKNAAVYMEATFTCELAEGDVVIFVKGAKSKQMQLAASSDASTKAKTTDYQYVIPAESPLIGKDKIYVWGYDGGEGDFGTMRIVRPYTITLTAGAGATCSASSVNCVQGGKVILPHAFKSGVHFKGWYTASTGGEKADNYYEATSDVELFAQFEELASSGTMFSLEMDDELKPAANCTIRNATIDLLTYATIDGGSAEVISGDGNHIIIMSASPQISIAGSTGKIHVVLDFALQNGDEISTDFSAKTYISKTSSSSTPYVDGTNQTYTIIEGDGLKEATELYFIRQTNSTVSTITINRPAPAATYTVTLNPAGGAIDPVPSGWTLTAGQYVKSDVEDGSEVALLALTKDGYLLDGWKDGESNDYTSPVTIDGADLTLTAQWASAHTVSFAANGGGGSMSSVVVKDGSTYTIPACGFTPEDANHAFTNWVISGVAGKTEGVPDETFTMPTGDVTLTAQWATSYAITKGTHANGDFTIDPTSAAAGATISLEATPNANYLFSAWEVVKTEDGSATGITVDGNGQFEMPAYAVTVNATFVADPRPKVLYLVDKLTSGNYGGTAADKLYAALKDDYNVTVAAAGSQTLTDYDLVVLHESIDGKAAASSDNTNKKQVILDILTTTIPVLNTKSYFYNNANSNDRWGWGTPNAGTSVKGATQNSAYCNITSHPLFAGVTVTDGFFEVTDEAAAKCMQPIGAFTTGLEGYTLATTPNASEGNGCAIHEIPADNSVRGVGTGKYLMISVSNAKLNALNANGQKLFQNAAAYLLSATAWTPVVAPSDPGIAGTTAYSAGETIELTASATGTSATTTYTWYKGDTWAEAETAGAIQAAKTAAEDGNVYSKATCVVGDAGTYWCVIANGVGCTVSASQAITVSDESYDITFVSDHGTAPTATTGVSYDLTELTESGWVHQGWTASIDVTVDAATVTTGTLIANGKTVTFGADVEFTAVWAQVFAVTFNMQDHGDAIDPQNIVSGGKVTEPTAPTATDFDFGGWYKEAGCTNAWDFANDVVTETTVLYAKWTADPCGSSERKSLSKVVLTAANDGTVTGYNNDEYAGAKVIGGLSGTETAEVDPSHEGTETGYKLNSGGSAIVFATLKKGTFQEGDRVVVTITKKQDAYKVESVAQPILDIYYGTNKDDATLLATIDNVTSAGSYTYRLTAADITAIGDKKGIGVFRPSSGRTQNPYVYSVEIQGCRSWAVSHNVTFNMKDHGTQVDPQVVPEGDHVSKPSVVEPEGWAFCGWYKETTLENEWNFATDVMGTEDITLYAKWESEAGVIKLFNNTGDLNTEKFVSAAKAEDPIEIESVNYPCLVAFANNRSSLAGAAQADVVQYNAATDAAKIKLDMYNNNSGSKTAYLWMVEEGDTESGDPIAIEIPGKTRLTTSYYAFNSTKNRSFYVTSGAKSDIKILQVKVLDNGTAIPQFGQAGYSVNLNKGRIIAAANATIPFEEASIHSNDAYTVLNSSNLKLKTYIQFENAVANTTVKITKASSNPYYVTNDLENKGTSYTTDQEIVLTTTGSWYIGSVNSGSVAALSKIEFIAPKCEAPTFDALTNSDICSGDPYVALDGTGTVSDGGTITYKWYAHGADESDPESVLATTATYTPTADGTYYVKALHHVDGYTENEATSDEVTVTTYAGTVISEPLVNLRGVEDAVVTLTVTASGKNPHYTWKECATIDGTYTNVAGAADAASLNVTITSGMSKYYKVVVHSDCGDDQESIAKVEEFVPVVQADVDGSIVWDWTEAASVNEIKLTSSTTPKKNEGFVMANGAATIYNNANFESDKLYLEGEYIIRGGTYFQGQTVKFNTTVAGAVRVKFSNTGGNPARELYINGVGTGNTSANATMINSDLIEVPAGEVSITAYLADKSEDASQKYIRISKIEFYALDQTRSDSWIAPGELGTICYPNGHVVIGAEMYEMAGVNEYNKFVFDEVTETEPGKPYLFRATSTNPIKFYKTLAAAAATAGTSNGMVGTFSDKYIAAGTANIYYFSGQKFYAVATRSTDLFVAANRAYVDLNEPHPALAPKFGVRRITFDVQGTNTATGVENVQSDNVQSTKMLIDGNLYILRGEKMYDATGHLVK